ncbi:hypothetical protein GCM10028820_19940 [Tessaracoccus terricola]
MAIVGAALLLTACTGAPEPDETPPVPTVMGPTTAEGTSSPAEPEPTAPTTSATEAPTSSPRPETPTATVPDESSAPWLTDASSQEPGAAIPDDSQEIIGVRTGAHPGFDRVVLDLSDEEPVLGWFAGFTDEAVEDPTGEPLEVDGVAFLQLGVFGIDWLNESPERYSGDTVPGDGLVVVTEVVFGGLFEGQQQVVLGLREQSAYRVFALSDPARIVIDVRHG